MEAQGSVKVVRVLYCLLENEAISLQVKSSLTALPLCLPALRQLNAGAGARHFPEPQVDRSAAAGLNERREEFETKTAKNYCKDFPGLVRASTPLYIKSAGPQVSVGALSLPHSVVIA